MVESARESTLSEPWRAALERFDRDLSARAAAESTRRAYGADLEQLYDTLESRDLAAGSPLARRLFS